MSITLLLVIVTGFISYQAFNNPELKAKLMFIPDAVNRRNEYYRFLTSGFVHADFNHLLINLFVLYMFGQVVEELFQAYFGQIGIILYLILYLGAIIAANYPDYLIHRDHFGYAALGASGGTSALVFAYIFIDPWEWLLFPPVPILLFAVGYLWYSNRMAKIGADNIGHNAHFSGSVFGFLATLLFGFLFNADLVSHFLIMLLQGPKAPPFF